MLRRRRYEWLWWLARGWQRGQRTGLAHRQTASIESRWVTRDPVVLSSRQGPQIVTSQIADGPASEWATNRSEFPKLMRLAGNDCLMLTERLARCGPKQPVVEAQIPRETPRNPLILRIGLAPRRLLPRAASNCRHETNGLRVTLCKRIVPGKLISFEHVRLHLTSIYRRGWQISFPLILRGGKVEDLAATIKLIGPIY
jgi:hypothetical protein